MFLGQFLYCRNVFNACVCALIFLTSLSVSAGNLHARSRADAMLIIDSSISMSGKIGKKSKISLVRKSLRPALKSARPRLNLGVIFFGHRRRGDCTDVQHVIRLGRIRQKRYMQIIRDKERSPKGRTPISDAVKMAAGILKKRSQSNSIVLVTDGVDICKSDPCKLGKRLQQKNSGLKVHVIALRSKKSKMTALRCLARETGGKYIAANSPIAITKAVEDTFRMASSGNIPIPKISPRRFAQLPKVEETDSEEIDKAEVEATITPETVSPGLPKKAVPAEDVRTVLPEKIISPKPSVLPETPVTKRAETAVTKRAETTVTKPEKIPADKKPDDTKATETTSSVFDSFFGPGKKIQDVKKTPAAKKNDDADTKPQAPEKGTIDAPVKPVELPKSGLSLAARMGAGGPVIENDLFWRIFSAEKTGGKQSEIRQTGAAQPLLELEPGEYDVTVQFDTIVQRQLVTIAAHKTTDVVITLDAGIIEARAVKVAGGKTLDQDISYTLVSTNKGDTGKRTEINRKTTSQTRFVVKPGRYQLTGKFGATTITTDITVTTGKTSVANLIFNTGVLKVSTVAARGGAVIKGASYLIYEAEAGADGQRKQLYKSTKNQSRFTLPAGTYRLKVEHGEASIERTIKITANKSKVLILNLNAGYLKLFATPAKGAGILKDKVHYTIYKGGESLDGKREKVTQSTKSAPTFWLPAGKYHVKATYGLASADIPVKISANKRSEKTIIINAGALQLSSMMVGSAEKLKSQVFYVIYDAKADIEGKHREIFTTSQAERTVRIPPGEYIIEGQWGNTNAKTPVSAIVTAGKLTSATVTHRAGRVKFKLTAVPGGAPTGKPYWTFYDGNGTEIGRNVKPTPERIFAAGKYAVVVRHADQEFKAEFTIKSGDEKQIDIVAKQ